MPWFAYRAKRGPSETVDGEMEAESEAAVVRALDGMGCSPVWVRPRVGLKRGGDPRNASPARIRPRSVTLFTRQLAGLTKSGVPILRALSTVADQAENRRFGDIIRDVEHAVRDGQMLSDALAVYPRLFPELYVNIVRAGESAGALDTVLFRMARARERDEEMRRKVQAAVAYPLLVLIVGALTVFVLLAFFLPRMLPLFAGRGDLPLPTRMLIGVTSFFSQNWFWILAGVGIAVAGIGRLLTSEATRMAADRMKLAIPGLRRLILEADLVRFSRTLALLLEAGLPIDRALGLSANTLQNGVLRREIINARDLAVREGMPVSVGLKRSPHIPGLMINMVAVGEEAGRLEESLAETAAFYEDEVEQRGRLIASLLEPILILAVGTVVGFIVAAMLLPIFQFGKGL